MMLEDNPSSETDQDKWSVREERVAQLQDAAKQNEMLLVKIGQSEIVSSQVAQDNLTVLTCYWPVVAGGSDCSLYMVVQLDTLVVVAAEGD